MRGNKEQISERQRQDGETLWTLEKSEVKIEKDVFHVMFLKNNIEIETNFG